MAQRGWTPATSSNFSRRIDDRHAAITISGRDKGKLGEADIMGGRFRRQRHRQQTIAPRRKTLLHTMLYKRFAEIGCVLHTHSQTQTVASRLFAGVGHVHLQGYELLKAFAGKHHP